jgi:hypothetical protein
LLIDTVVDDATAEHLIDEAVALLTAGFSRDAG